MARKSLASVMKLINREINESSPEKSFLNDLQKSIEMDDRKNARPRSNYYKPSCMNCIRQMYYIRTGEQESESTMGYQLIGICNSGSDTHIRIQTAVDGMAANGMDCEYVDVADFVRSRNLADIEIISKNGMETKLFNKQFNLSFLCDGIIRYKGIYYILELKTENSNKFWTRENVDPSHYNQAICYSLSLGLNEVIFIYINRDNSEMKSYMFEVTQEMKQEVIGLITNCDFYVDQKKVPDKPEVERKTCSYCSYQDQCRRDG